MGKNKAPGGKQDAKVKVSQIPEIDGASLNEKVIELHRANQLLEELAKFPQENPNPVMRVEKNGKILFANNACSMLESFKCQAGQILPNRYQKIVTEILRRGSPQTVELEGDQRIFALYVVPIIKSGYVNIYGHDITELKRAEESLRENENLFHAFFDSPGVMRGIVELAGNDVRHIVDNSMAATFLGLSQYKLRNKLSSELGEPREITEIWTKHYRESKRKHEPVTFEYLDVRAGKRIWLSASVTHLGTTPQEQQRFAYVIRDITDRKEAEKELRETRDYLENLIRYANAPIIVWNPEFEITRFNHAFEHLTGRTAAEVMGKKLGILFPDNSRKASMDLIRKTSTGERWEAVEIPIVNKDGMVRIVLWNSAVILSFDRKTTMATIAQGQDITERKTAEEALKESEERFRVLMETSPVGVGVVSSDGEIFYANPAYESILGYRHGELEGKKAPDLYADPKDRRSWLRIMADKGVVKYFESRLKRKDGRRIWVSISASPILFQGKPGIMGTIQDITEAKQSEESLKKYASELEAANKELESFSYSASHDLRAPLRTLDGFSEILIQEYGDKLDETGKDYLNRIRKASQNMSQLIDDMAKLSRITQVGMNYQEVDLSEMARSILKEFKEYQPERKADFIIAPHMKAKADDQLTLILMRNLLENAWKFTSRCPLTKIEFGISSQRGKEVYFIKDNGIGFDMKYADKLFKPFQRIHSEKDYTGTGIGLAIVQRVVQRHGGRIWAESEVSKGATFFFTLG